MERAVKTIQQAILESDPKVHGCKFTIETNKIVKVAGVRHEIDVFVQTLPGSPYESTSIFECKDLKKPVSKNAVMILSKKVDAIRANRGFLVAKSLTKDAAAQLKCDERLRYIRCSHEIRDAFEGLEIMHTVHNTDHAGMGIKHRGVPPTEQPKKLVPSEAKCCLNGKPIDILQYGNQRILEMVAEDYKNNAAKYLHEGTHPSAGAVRIDFTPGEFTIDGKDIEYMTLEVRFMVTVRKRKLVSKFELEGQGRVFSYDEEDDSVFGKLPQIDIIQRK